MFSYIKKYFKKKNLDLAKSSKSELRKFYYLVKIITRHGRLRKEVNLVRVEQIGLSLWFHSFNSLIEEINRVRKEISNNNFSRPNKLEKKNVSLENYVKTYGGFKLLKDKVSNSFSHLVNSSLNLCNDLNEHLLTDMDLRTFEVTYSYLLQDINELLILMLEEELKK